MTGNDIRSKFIEYFKKNGHTAIESSALVPHDDPTLLFTNAGMVQFKRVFMGEEKRDYTRAVSSQRCVRAGGKHNDLENVGHTARHHTFFEMLGNFSFGDYFKEEAIRLAWEFLTEELQLPKDKLWVSVFEEDDEAFEMWKKVDLLPGRVIRLGEKDNFWAMGDTGPCGPCSEIHIDQGPEVGCQTPECQVGCPNDCDRYLELWNLVFMQFYRDSDGNMTALPKPSIDTGMGLERIAAVVQGKYSNYDSDLFSGLIEQIACLAGKKYGDNEQDNIAMRVIADHSRTTAFLVADGVLPSNEGRGYVLRRIMRRAVRFGRALGLKNIFLHDVTAAVVRQMSTACPHLLESTELLDKVARNEEERFRETLDNGLAILNTEMNRLDGSGSNEISGDFIFKLYDTYGFPLDIVRDIAMENHYTIDEAGFVSAMAEQRQRSKKSWKEGGLAAMATGIKTLIKGGHKSCFIGYESHQAESTIDGMVDDNGSSVSSAGQGRQISIFCPETPFYAEAGGQIGDHGKITGPNGSAEVIDTIIVGDGLILHEAEVVEGTLAVGDTVTLKVAEGRRQCIANNHTATHLLHAALKSVLGDHIKQSGSLVTEERLRFDFTHFSPLTDDEIHQVETLVNEEIRSNRKTDTRLLSKDEAMQQGATALFGEKYGDEVRVVCIGEFSMELCGGTHVGRTGEIGLLKIVSETGIAAGIRRIEAVTGPAAFNRFQDVEQELVDMAARLKSSPEELGVKLAKLLTRQKELEKEVSSLNARLSLANLDSLIAAARVIGGVKVIATDVFLDSPKTLRQVGDKIRDKLGSGVVILGGVHQHKAALLAMATKDLTDKLNCGEIIKEIAAIVGGKGGGRPDMAQAGGPFADKLNAALQSAVDIVSKKLN